MLCPTMLVSLGHKALSEEGEHSGGWHVHAGLVAMDEPLSDAACFLASGCMAERLKEKILHRERLVDIVAGPDAYRDLPRLLAVAESGQQAANVLLSLDETYADVLPVQTSLNATSAFV